MGPSVSSWRQKVLDLKWAYRIEDDENDPKYKACLVAKGFLQEKWRDYNETFASVAKMTTLRIVLAVANHNQLFLHQMDIETAFLNGELLVEAYMK